MVPFEVALTAVFVEGFVFVGLTLLGIRQWLARYVHIRLLPFSVGVINFVRQACTSARFRSHLDPIVSHFATRHSPQKQS